MKYLFIINPIAGKGHALSLIPYIKECFKDCDEELILEITKGPKDATRIVKDYVSKGIYRVFSVGGDGTLNEVLNGMIGSESSLSVIPAGSGNDYIKSICNFDINDVKDIIKRTITGVERYADLARVNDRYFINISSIGFDADAVYSTIKFKSLPLISGSLAYILGIFAAIAKNKIRRIEIEVDEVNMNDNITLIAVGKGKYYGGGMKALPYADIEDGFLHVCLVKSLSRLKVLMLFPQYMKGKHESIREVSLFKAKKIHIKSEEEFSVNVDGELIYSREVNFEIIHKGIIIFAPKY